MTAAKPIRRVAATALSTPHFLLLYAAMLVAAAGNTALQSVMPAIGREIGIADFWVAIAYTWSAIAVGDAGALLGGEERPPRPQGADPDGPRRLHRLDAAVRAGPGRRACTGDRRRADLHPVRDLPRDLRRARLRDPVRDPGLSRLEDPAQRPGRGAFGFVVVVRPRDDHRPGAGAVVRASVRRPARAAVRLFRRSACWCSPRSGRGFPTTGSAARSGAARR